MSHIEQVSPIYRTSPRRAANMMAIMLGICIVGGVIFFGMWDYWLSGTIPTAGDDVKVEAPAVFTGKEIPITLNFVESTDFLTLAFNALPGDPDNNPTINAEVGDKIIFDVQNIGKSFHAFGVTKETEGFSGIIPGTAVASGSNPLKPGEGGESQFIPGQEGIYYYICTVPGHRLQGMVGQIIVGNVAAETEKMPVTPTDTPIPAPEEEPAPEMIVTEETEQPLEPAAMEEFTGTISLPSGSSVPGCEKTNQCYIPAEVTINIGQTVIWSNDDLAAHTVTSGNPTAGPDGTFDSSLFMAGKTFSYTFDKSGDYNYYCMVHPWMTGKIQVN